MNTTPSIPEGANSAPASKGSKITFNEVISVKTVPHLREMSDEEFEALWYSDDELAEVTIVSVVASGNNNKVILQKPAKDNKINLQDEDYSNDDHNEADCATRGLEHLASPEALKAHKKRRETVVAAVLREQQKQTIMERLGAAAAAGFNKTGYEEEVLRQVSTRLTTYDRVNARALGMSDEAFVHHHLRNEGAPPIESAPGENGQQLLLDNHVIGVDTTAEEANCQAHERKTQNLLSILDRSLLLAANLSGTIVPPASSFGGGASAMRTTMNRENDEHFFQDGGGDDESDGPKHLLSVLKRALQVSSSSFPVASMEAPHPESIIAHPLQRVRRPNMHSTSAPSTLPKFL